MELEQVFSFGYDFIDRIEELTLNAFWKDVLFSLKPLWKSNCILNKHAIHETPIYGTILLLVSA